MEGITFESVNTSDGNIKITIISYNGDGDPVEHIDKAIKYYVTGRYKEFVDEDPRIRIIVQNLYSDEIFDKIDEISKKLSDGIFTEPI